jgi:hypothetical protein
LRKDPVDGGTGCEFAASVSRGRQSLGAVAQQIFLVLATRAEADEFPRDFVAAPTGAALGCRVQPAEAGGLEHRPASGEERLRRLG